MIKERLAKVKESLPPGVKLVAVSKTKSVSDILEAYNEGQRAFGENKAQELISKYPELPDDIEWHMIGHLQTNKVKFIAPFAHLIHSVDSLKLLKTINKEARKNNRVIDCLLQIHIAREQTKFGLDENEIEEIFESEAYSKLTNIRIVGLMGMATFTEDQELVRKEFHYLAALFNKIKISWFPEDDSFRELSMGMSGDYLLAVKEGSTIVRVGSLIFGERKYNK
jgi:pyridoxal phosphate enzyme (YggS family)